MSLVIIGEAATRIMEGNPEFVGRHPQVPWRAMRGLRNRIAHGYFDLDLAIVWETVRSALPVLNKQLPEILQDALLGYSEDEEPLSP